MSNNNQVWVQENLAAKTIRPNIKNTENIPTIISLIFNKFFYIKYIIKIQEKNTT